MEFGIYDPPGTSSTSAYARRVFYNNEFVKKIYFNDKLVYSYFPYQTLLFGDLTDVSNTWDYGNKYCKRFYDTPLDEMKDDFTSDYGYGGGVRDANMLYAPVPGVYEIVAETDENKSGPNRTFTARMRLNEGEAVKYIRYTLSPRMIQAYIRRTAEEGYKTYSSYVPLFWCGNINHGSVSFKVNIVCDWKGTMAAKPQAFYATRDEQNNNDIDVSLSQAIGPKYGQWDWLRIAHITFRKISQ